MSLQELYQQMILEHAKQPRNFGVDAQATHQQCGHNKVCGDELTLYVRVEGEKIEQVHFTGSGCAISMASASLLTEALAGRTIAEAEAIFNSFHHLVTGTEDPAQVELGKLKVMAGVRAFPIRVKCASLAWHTFQAALEAGDKPDAVSTE